MSYSPASGAAMSGRTAIGKLTCRRVVRDAEGNVLSDTSQSTIQTVPEELAQDLLNDTQEP